MILDFGFWILDWLKCAVVVVFIAAALLVAGCEDKPLYPPEIAGLARQALAEARACAGSVKKGVKTEGSPRVELVKGEKKIAGYWCWRSPEWNGAWVGGLFDGANGYRIRIGHNPVNRADVNFDVLKHEMGHYVLVTSWGDWNHTAAYRKCFIGWSGATTASRNKPRLVEITSDSQIVTLFYEDEINRLEAAGHDVAD